VGSDNGEDKQAQHRRALLHGAPKARARQPSAGEEVWRVRTPEGDIHSCELRDHSRQGAGWELQILHDGEILVCRQCDNEQHARRVAEMASLRSIAGHGDITLLGRAIRPSRFAWDLREQFGNRSPPLAVRRLKSGAMRQLFIEPADEMPPSRGRSFFPIPQFQQREEVVPR
jgi:hypothetical protein